MPSVRRDPLADPLVSTWDALVTGTANTEQLDQQAFDTLTSLHEAFDGPEIDTAFLSRLETELFGAQAQDRAAAAGAAALPSRSPGDDERGNEKPPKLVRLIIDNLAIAAILAIVLGGLAVTFVSKRSEPQTSGPVPAIIDSQDELERALNPPTPESLLDISVDPAGLGTITPDQWDRMDFALVHVQPDSQFTTDHPYFSCCPGMGVFQVRQSTATFQVDSAVDLYPADSGGAVYRIPAGTLLALGPGDTAVFALENPAIITNTGAGELLMLGGYAYQHNSIPGIHPGPEGYAERPVTKKRDLELDNAAMLDMQFERTTLDPGELMQFEVVPGVELAGWYPEMDTSVRMLFGAHDEIPADYSDSFAVQTYSLSNFAAGPYTLFNAGNHPATVHFMRLAPSSEQPASQEPAPQSAVIQSSETSLDITITPSDLGAADPSTWEAAELVDVRVEPGTSFSTDNPWFQCCAGIAVYQVREGVLELTVDGPAEIYRADSSAAERIDSVTAQTLGPGDSVVLASQTIATFANPSATDDLRLIHGMAYKSSNPLGAAIPPDGFEKEMHLVDTEFEALPASSIDLSLESIHLEPGALTHFEVDPAQRVLGWYPEPDSMVRILEGTHDSVPENDRGTFLVRTFTMRIYDPGPYTLYNSSETATTLYLMRMAPAAAQPAATPEATPAATPVAALEPQPIESLLNIQVNPSELDAQTSDKWDVMEFSLVTVKAGEGFTTDHLYFTNSAGMIVFQVREGSASIVVDGPADFYADGSGQAPVRIPAATLFALESGQAAVFAMENAAIVTNTGGADLVMLGGYGYEFLGPMTTIVPEGYHDQPTVGYSGMDPIPAESLEVSFEQVTLEPGELTHIESREEERVAGWIVETNTTVRMTPGELDAIPTDLAGSFTAQTFVRYNFNPGPYTFFNTGENPATLTLMRIAPADAAAPVAATPVASPVAALEPQTAETLLNIQVTPADLDALTPDQWDQMEFSLVTVEVGDSFTTDHPFFTCCGGMAVFQVREGSASFVVDGPVDLYASGQGPARIPVGNLFALETGDTAVFAMEHPAIVTNTGANELQMLGGYGYEHAGSSGPHSEPDGYTGQPVVIGTGMDALPAGALDVSFEQISLEPGALTHIESNPEERLVGWFPETNTTVRMQMGEHYAIPTDPLASSMVHSFVMNDFSPGPYTFFNAGKNPATLHLMRIVPVSSPAPAAAPETAMPEEGTETSASAQPLSLLVADPDALPIGDPETWNETRLELAYLEAGESYESGSNPAACCRPGLAGLQVIEGTLDIELAGPAQITRAGDLVTVEEFAGPGSVSLAAGDAIWYGLDANPRLANDGESRATFLNVTANLQPDPPNEAAAETPAYGQIGNASDTASTALASGPVQASIYEMSLGPHASIPVDVHSGEPALAVVADGQIRYYEDTGGAPPGASLMHEPDADNGIAFHALPPGSWMIENSRDTPATVYLLRLTNDIPVQVADQGWEFVVNAAFRPTAHSFGADPGWDQAYLAESTLEPFSSVSSTDPAFGCCNGVQVITVLEGELTVQMDLPMQVMYMSNDPASAGNPVVLSPGESALYESHMIATNTGTTTARFLHGGVYTAEPTTEVSTTEYGFFAGQRAVTAFTHNPEDSLQSLNIDRATIEPGQELPLTITANDAYLLVSDGGTLNLTPASGADPELSANPVIITSSFSSEGLEPGNYLLTNPGTNPVTVYTLRIGPDLAPPVP